MATTRQELDANKKGLSEASRNARQVSRFLDDIMRGVTKEQIDAGLVIPSGYSGNHGKKASSGRLFFQTRPPDGSLPDVLPGNKPDNSILLIEWGEKFPRLVRERDVEIALEREGESERRITITTRVAR